MRIVMGAQNCGFGPASELVAISRLLSGHERVFVGDGVASAFARRNADAFDEIHEATVAHGTAGSGAGAESVMIDDLLENSDQVVSVMDADLVLRAVVAGRPTVMVDSLFSFWQIGSPLTRIRDLCRTLPRFSFKAADQHLADLSPHERIVERPICSPRTAWCRTSRASLGAWSSSPTSAPALMHLTGSIIDLEGLRNVPLDAEPECDLLINVGGFKNFLLDFEVNNDYVRLLQRWIPDLLRDWPRFPRVLVCGGPFGEHRGQTVSAAGGRADCCFLPQRELLRRVASTPHYLLAPGLTALHESVALGRLPLALHEQHYAHVFTVRGLEGTSSAGPPGRFADVLPYHPVPEDDFAGTAALVEIAGRIRADDELYGRFRQTLNERIEHHVSLTPAQRLQAVEELRDVLGSDRSPR